jgi:trk system potassium uptake protein TrkH
MDVASMSGASHFLICVLMFVGGSPGSTAGGVKTTAAAVLVLGVWNTLRSRNRVEAFGRCISDQVVGRAAVVVVVMFLLVTGIVLVLLFTESASLHEVLFESVSAFGTVGLSTGLTERLTVAGRLTIMLAMFAGRLGPLTVLIALAGENAVARYEYAVEEVSIG